MKKPLLFIPLLFIGLFACEQEPTPEDALRTWLGYMQNGECDNAVQMIPEMSMEPIVLDCEAYEGEIISITCESTEESASCLCKESRNGEPAQDYEYELKKVDGGWKIVRGY